MDLKNLTILELTETDTANLEPLSNLESLIELNLTSILAKDISPLKSLKNLKKLSLLKTVIDDISPLHFLKRLSYLYIDTVSSMRLKDQLFRLKNKNPNLRIEIVK